MNLYDIYNKPKELYGYDRSDMEIPEIFWNKHKNNSAELKKREQFIAKNAKWSYYYAHDVLKGPFKLGEPTIAKDARWSYWYALHILHGPFKLGEPATAKDAEYSYFYAYDVLKGPFYLDGKLIAKP